MSGATRVERGETYAVRTGAEATFQLPIHNAVTVTILVSSPQQVSAEYPRFVLESTDGAHRETKGARDDLVPGDEYLQLRFERLLPGRRYTLRQQVSADCSIVEFEDVPFEDVLDRSRPPPTIAVESSAYALRGPDPYDDLTVEMGEG